MSLSTRDLIIADLDNELRQLQSEWAAVSEYCAELQTQQQNIQQDISSAQLEEKLLTKKLREILGEAEGPTSDGYFLDETNKNNQTVHNEEEAEREMRLPWRVLNVEEKEKAGHLVFLSPSLDAGTSTANLRDESMLSAGQAAALFVLGPEFSGTEHQQQQQINSTSFFGDQQKASRAVRSAACVNLSGVIDSLCQRVEQAQSVGAVLQRQKEALTARLHQGGAVSVALDAMLLYRQPVM